MNYQKGYGYVQQNESNFGDPELLNVPDFMGHATFPGQMKNKNNVFNMLRGFGGELYAISRSEKGDYNSSNGQYQHNTAYDINSVGARIENVLYGNQQPMPTQQQAPIYRNVQQPMKQNFQNYNNINTMNEDDINKYLGGSTTANSGETTSTSIDFSAALKPLEAKAEMICKLLGKIYQVENDTNVIVKGLGQEIAESVSASFETYMNQNVDVPVPEDITADIDTEI